MDCDVAPYLFRWAGCWLQVGLMWITVVTFSTRPPCSVSMLTWATVRLWPSCWTTELRFKSLFVLWNFQTQIFFAVFVFGCNWKIVLPSPPHFLSCIPRSMHSHMMVWLHWDSLLRLGIWTSSPCWVSTQPRCSSWLSFCPLDFKPLCGWMKTPLRPRVHWSVISHGDLNDFTSGRTRLSTNKNTCR